MDRIRRTSIRLAVTVMATAALTLPVAAPASAHGRLPTGKYPCWHYVGGQVMYTYFDLYIRSNNRYVFKLGEERVGRAGRFRHPAGSQRIRFRTGYLANQGFKGLHQRSAGDHSVRLAYDTDYGTAYYYCSD